MNQENIDINNNETVVAPAPVIDGAAAPTLSVEELAKQLAEVKGFNARLLQENKELKGKPTDEVLVVKEDKKEDVVVNNTQPLTNVITREEVDLKEQGFSWDEINRAKQFVGALGSNVVEVAASAGFKAIIADEREKKQSIQMMDNDSLELKPIETKKSVIEDIENGVIDINAPGNESYRKMYVDHKASNLK